jgi:hypothetical protein
MHNMTTVLIGPNGVAFFLLVASDGGSFGGFGAQSPQHLVMAMAAKFTACRSPFLFGLQVVMITKFAYRCLLALAYDLCINVGDIGKKLSWLSSNECLPDSMINYVGNILYI